MFVACGFCVANSKWAHTRSSSSFWRTYEYALLRGTEDSIIKSSQRSIALAQRLQNYYEMLEGMNGLRSWRRRCQVGTRPINRHQSAHVKSKHPSQQIVADLHPHCPYTTDRDEYEEQSVCICCPPFVPSVSSRWRLIPVPRPVCGFRWRTGALRPWVRLATCLIRPLGRILDVTKAIHHREAASATPLSYFQPEINFDFQVPGQRATRRGYRHAARDHGTEYGRSVCRRFWGIGNSIWSTPPMELH